MVWEDIRISSFREKIYSLILWIRPMQTYIKENIINLDNKFIVIITINLIYCFSSQHSKHSNIFFVVLQKFELTWSHVPSIPLLKFYSLVTLPRFSLAQSRRRKSKKKKKKWNENFYHPSPSTGLPFLSVNVFIPRRMPSSFPCEAL